MNSFKIKLFNTFLAFVLSTVSVFLAFDSAEARRMGFGRSIGKSPPIKRQVIPPSNTQAVKKPAAPVNNAAAANKSRGGFMGPLAGIAAGLGLAALASYLGIGEEIMSLLLIMLIGVAIFFVFRFFSRRMLNKPSYEGVSNNLNRSVFEDSNHPNTIKNRPSSNIREDISDSSEINDEEKNNFIKNAKSQFIDIQKIWDSGDIKKLSSYCTNEMLIELTSQISELRDKKNKTSFTELTAQWEGHDTFEGSDGKVYEEVYVLFSGLVRENEDGLTERFSETWTLQKSKEGNDGWLIAGISQTD